MAHENERRQIVTNAHRLITHQVTMERSVARMLDLIKQEMLAKQTESCRSRDMELEGRPLLVLGTGVFAQELADLASEIPLYRVTGFVENLVRDRCDRTLNGLPVYWVNDIDEFATSHVAICSLGTTHRSRFIEQVRASVHEVVRNALPKPYFSAKKW